MIIQLKQSEAAADLPLPTYQTELSAGVDLQAAAGEVVAIIGSSGSGKSTLLRCVNLLEIPQAGCVTLCGEAVTFVGKGAVRRPAKAQQVRRLRARRCLLPTHLVERAAELQLLQLLRQRLCQRLSDQRLAACL